MLQNSFTEVFDKFKLQFYKNLFELIKEREGSLSAMEAFSVEVIRMLGNPTISQFADFLNISQSNATYKVNSLIRKGYIERENSPVDHREYHLVLSDKYYKYIGLLSSYESTVMQRIEQHFPAEDVQKLDGMLAEISRELMPECSQPESGRPSPTSE